MQTKSQSEKIAEAQIKTLEAITDQCFAMMGDVVTGKVSHQRVTSSVGAARAALNSIELEHKLGGDVSRYLKK